MSLDNMGSDIDEMTVEISEKIQKYALNQIWFCFSKSTEEFVAFSQAEINKKTTQLFTHNKPSSNDGLMVPSQHRAYIKHRTSYH